MPHHRQTSRLCLRSLILSLALVIGENAFAETCPLDRAICESAASLEPLETSERERVEAGEIVLRHGQMGDTKTRTVSVAVIVPARPEQVWAVITDFESWPQFVPHLDEVEVDRSQEATGIVDVAESASVMWTEISFATRRYLSSDNRSMWVELDRSKHHDIGDVAGIWQLEPIRGGEQTLLRVKSAVDTGKPLPAFVERMLAAKSLPESVRAVANEVERRRVVVASAN